MPLVRSLRLHRPSPRGALLLAGLAVAALVPVVLSVSASAGGGGGCVSPITDGDGAHVSLSGACFSPMVINVGAGDTVEWTNDDEYLDHTVTDAGLQWGTLEKLRPGHSELHRFEEAGVFPYYCFYHPGMAGAVVVSEDAASGAAAVPPAQASSPDFPRTMWLLLASSIVVVAAIATVLATRRRAASISEI